MKNRRFRPESAMTRAMRIVETNEALAAFLAELAGRPLSGAGHRIPARPDLLSQALPDPGGGARRRGHHRSAGARAGPGAVLRTAQAPDIVKVLHAARQDIEIFYLQGGVLPEPLFDTQIAAMVCGFGDAASYETLARKLAHVEIDKSARFTDWSHRPLSKRQLEYALADVTHLRVIYEWLRRSWRAPAAPPGWRKKWRRCRIPRSTGSIRNGLETAEAAHHQQALPRPCWRRWRPGANARPRRATFPATGHQG